LFPHQSIWKAQWMLRGLIVRTWHTLRLWRSTSALATGSLRQGVVTAEKWRDEGSVWTWSRQGAGPEVWKALNRASLTIEDGIPLVWSLKSRVARGPATDTPCCHLDFWRFCGLTGSGHGGPRTPRGKPYARVRKLTNSCQLLSSSRHINRAVNNPTFRLTRRIEYDSPTV
jgi:hypothetical protein